MRTRLFVVLLVLATASAFAAGWWYRARTNPTPEERIHETTERLNDAWKSLTR